MVAMALQVCLLDGGLYLAPSAAELPKTRHEEERRQRRSG